jgi:hypothetical protein
MYTAQANQIATAMRTAGGNAESAQEMMQAMCNCAQTLEHRGPVDFTYTDPWFANFPATAPPPGRVEPFARQTGFPRPPATNPPIPQIAPWNPVTWTNIPTVDMPTESAMPYPWGPWSGTPSNPGSFVPWSNSNTMYVGGGINTTQVTVNGPMDAGPITTTETTTTGDTTTGGTTTTDGVDNTGDTTNAGVVVNEGDTYLMDQTTIEGPHYTNNTTHTEGPQHHYGETWFFGPVNISFQNERRFGILNRFARILEAQRFGPDFCDVVTRVFLQGSDLFQEVRRLNFIGRLDPPRRQKVFTVNVEGASFDADICEIVPDNTVNKQISFVKSIE